MAQGKGVQADLSKGTIHLLESVSKSTWIDVLITVAREQLGNEDERQLLGLVDQWLEPVCVLRKMRPPLLQSHYQQDLVKRRVVAEEQAFNTKRLGKKARLRSSLKLRKE